MRSSDVCLTGFLALTLTLQMAVASGAEPSAADLRLDRLEIVNRTDVVAVSGGEVHLNGAPGAGLAWIKDLDVKQGCLALEVRGSDEEGRSFVGIAFRGVDNDTYDAVYLRPFVFQSDDPSRAANALQYMSMPDFGWPVLRQRSPGVYEKPLGSKPDPHAWIEIVAKFDGKKVQVYVDGSKTPQLDVPLLTQHDGGRVALWVGNNSSGGFRKLRRCD
jgi:hypothetical protein